MKNTSIFRIFFYGLIIILSIHTINAKGQWYQQTLPVDPEIIFCMKFFNQNTGWMATGSWQTSYMPKILKTTDGGNNWYVLRDSTEMYYFQVLDSVTLYGRVRCANNYEAIFRTFNGGLTWDSVSRKQGWAHNGHFFFNKDTGYVGSSDGDSGYVYKTTDGGVTLTQLYRNGNAKMGGNMFFFKQNVNGLYTGYCTGLPYMYKTTNSGNNWEVISGVFPQPHGLYFLNKDTGWVSNIHGDAVIQHTTNGGVNWTNQYTSLFSTCFTGDIYFSSYNRGWAGSADGYFIYTTTTGGQVWGRQTTPNQRTPLIYFSDSLHGWNYSGFQSAPYLSKTTNGGGVIIGITKNTSGNIPLNYVLEQNYPNPFNGSTVIEYSLVKKSTIGMNIYDITGRSIYEITANNQEAGSYKLRIDFGTLNLTSGTYFYKFIAVNEHGLQQFSGTRKMIYLK